MLLLLDCASHVALPLRLLKLLFRLDAMEAALPFLLDICDERLPLRNDPLHTLPFRPDIVDDKLLFLLGDSNTELLLLLELPELKLPFLRISSEV